MIPAQMPISPPHHKTAKFSPRCSVHLRLRTLVASDCAPWFASAKSFRKTDSADSVFGAVHCSVAFAHLGLCLRTLVARRGSVQWTLQSVIPVNATRKSDSADSVFGAVRCSVAFAHLGLRLLSLDSVCAPWLPDEAQCSGHCSP